MPSSHNKNLTPYQKNRERESLPGVDGKERQRRWEAAEARLRKKSAKQELPAKDQTYGSVHHGRFNDQMYGDVDLVWYQQQQLYAESAQSHRADDHARFQHQHLFPTTGAEDRFRSQQPQQQFHMEQMQSPHADAARCSQYGKGLYMPSHTQQAQYAQSPAAGPTPQCRMIGTSNAGPTPQCRMMGTSNAGPTPPCPQSMTAFEPRHGLGRPMSPMAAGAFSSSPVRPLRPPRTMDVSRQVAGLEEGQRALLWKEAEELLNKRKAEKNGGYPVGQAKTQMHGGQICAGDLEHHVLPPDSQQHRAVPQDSRCLPKDHFQVPHFSQDSGWSHGQFGASEVPMRLTQEIFGPTKSTSNRQSTCGNRAAMQKNSVTSAAQQLKIDMQAQFQAQNSSAKWGSQLRGAAVPDDFADNLAHASVLAKDAKELSVDMSLCTEDQIRNTFQESRDLLNREVQDLRDLFKKQETHIRGVLANQKKSHERLLNEKAQAQERLLNEEQVLQARLEQEHARHQEIEAEWSRREEERQQQMLEEQLQSFPEKESLEQTLQREEEARKLAQDRLRLVQEEAEQERLRRVADSEEAHQKLCLQQQEQEANQIKLDAVLEEKEHLEHTVEELRQMLQQQETEALQEVQDVQNRSMQTDMIQVDEEDLQPSEDPPLPEMFASLEKLSGDERAEEDNQETSVLERDEDEEENAWQRQLQETLQQVRVSLKGVGEAETESFLENREDEEKDEDENEQQEAEQKLEEEQQMSGTEKDVEEESSQLNHPASEVEEASEVIDPELDAEIARLQHEANLLREENKLLLLEKKPFKHEKSETTDLVSVEKESKEACCPSSPVPVVLDDAENAAKDKDQAPKAEVSTPKDKLDLFQRKWLQSEMEEIRSKAGSVRRSPFQLNGSRQSRGSAGRQSFDSESQIEQPRLSERPTVSELEFLVKEVMQSPEKEEQQSNLDAPEAVLSDSILEMAQHDDFHLSLNDEEKEAQIVEDEARKELAEILKQQSQADDEHGDEENRVPDTNVIVEHQQCPGINARSPLGDTKSQGQVLHISGRSPLQDANIAKSPGPMNFERSPLRDMNSPLRDLNAQEFGQIREHNFGKVAQSPAKQSPAKALRNWNSPAHMYLSPAKTPAHKARTDFNTPQSPAFLTPQSPALDPDSPAGLFGRFVVEPKPAEILELFHTLLQMADASSNPVPREAPYKRICRLPLPWRAQQMKTLMSTKESRAAAAKADSPMRCVIVGGGPVGLRLAIELAVHGHDVVVLEKRRSFGRINRLHLWNWCKQDLKDLGAKLFDPPESSYDADPDYCHIGITELQSLLLKAGLMLGVRLEFGVEYTGIECVPSKEGWCARTQSDAGIERLLGFDVLVGADGPHSVVARTPGLDKKFGSVQIGFSTAIGLTANFVGAAGRNGHQARQFAWARQFAEENFASLERNTGISLENCVYYHSSAQHYMVMTPSRESLAARGVFRNPLASSDLTSAANIEMERLREVARSVAEHFGLPKMDFALQPNDVALFDFSTIKRAERPCTVLSPPETMKNSSDGKDAMVLLAGDALLEPFWPEGLGVMRGFQSALDAVATVQAWGADRQRDAAMEVSQNTFAALKTLCAKTADRVLRRDMQHYAVDPKTRYCGYC